MLKQENVVNVTVNPGNVHDSAAFDGLYDRMTEKHPEIKGYSPYTQIQGSL